MSTSMTPGSGRGLAPHQLLALAIAGVFLLVGLAGWFVTGFDNWTEHNHSETLLGFAVNPLHNVVHLLVGAAGLALARTPGGARTYGWALAIAYGATFVYGLFAVDADWDFLNINGADNVLHLLSAAAGLLVALWPRRGADRDALTDAGVSRRPL